MSDLTSVIAAHLYNPILYPHSHRRDCSCGWKSSAGHGAQALDFAGHIAQAIRDACTITTVEQLNALPDLAVVIDRDRDMHQKRDSLWCSYETAPLAASTMRRYLPAQLLWTT